MIGFTAYLGNEQVDLRKGVPSGNESILEAPLAGGKIIFWGGQVGDVQFIESPDGEALIVCGCVHEIKGGPHNGTQRERCLVLMKLIGECESVAQISAVAARVKGSFSLFYHKAKSGSAICVSDRLASRPLWTARTNGGWIISSHVMAAALAGVKRFSPVGVGAFLLYGGPIDPTHSPFEGITSVPQGTVTRLLANGRVESDKWYAFRHKPDRQIPFWAWVDLIAEQLVRAAQRIGQSNSRPTVFFSGGTDSRLLAAAMKAGGVAPLLLTLSDGPNLETRVSCAAARALGLEHRIIKRDQHWYLRTLRRAVFESGGVYLWTHGHFAAAAREANSKYGTDTFLLGDFCEAFSKLFCETDRANGSLWTTAEFVAAHDSIRLPLYRPKTREQTLLFLRKSIRDEVGDQLRQQMARRYEYIRSLADDPRIVGDLAFRWESVGLLPTFFMFLDVRSVAQERNIMFDPDVHDLLERVPSDMRNGRNLGAQLIRRLAPRAAWVVNSNSLVPMFWPPALHKSAKRVKPVMGKLRRAVLGKTHRTTGSWQERAHLYCGDPQWRASVESVVKGLDSLDEQLFDLDSWREACRSLLRGEPHRASDFEKLLQLELLSQMLQHGKAITE